MMYSIEESYLFQLPSCLLEIVFAEVVLHDGDRALMTLSLVPSCFREVVEREYFKRKVHFLWLDSKITKTVVAILVAYCMFSMLNQFEKSSYSQNCCNNRCCNRCCKLDHVLGTIQGRLLQNVHSGYVWRVQGDFQKLHTRYENYAWKCNEYFFQLLLPKDGSENLFLKLLQKLLQRLQCVDQVLEDKFIPIPWASIRQ